MLGHDVAYDSSATDNSLLDQAERDESVLLTRDEELYRRTLLRKIPSLLVEGEREEERLAEVAKEFHVPLVINMTLTKCPKCGARLVGIPKEKIAGLVPPATLKVYDEFWRCQRPKCGKVYWMGSHWRQINATLMKAKQLSD